MPEPTASSRCVAFWLALLALSAPVGGNEPETLTLSASDLESGSFRLQSWKYRPGDDPSWSRSDLDDTGWESIEATGLEELPQSGWPGIGWFRLRLRRSPDLEGRVLGFAMRQRGASEVYLDGELLARYGTVAADPEQEVAMWPRRIRPFPVYDTAEHVLAVRYSNSGDTRRPGSSARAFVFFLADLERTLDGAYDLLAGSAGRWKFHAGAALAFSLLHICLFAFRPEERSNLFFALAAAGFAGMQICDGLRDSATAPWLVMLLVRTESSNGILMLVGFMGFGQFFSGDRAPRLFRLQLAAAAVALVWTWVFVDLWAFYALVFVTVTTMTPGMVSLKLENMGDRILVLGFMAVSITGVLQVLMSMRVFGSESFVIYPYGMLFLFLALSIYLARHLAVTHQELEQQLLQVRDLSARALEQERRSHQQEIERRLLESDNARKTEELEQARNLQLSLLPDERPRAPRLELAFAMHTATEVGGDYYDYVESGDALTLALGDATGHGLQAGMVAMATKSLFQTTREDEDVAGALTRIARGIEGMRLGRMNMALALMRHAGGTWRLTSAGMPPFLLFRADSGEVEEIELPAPPLGTMRGHRYRASEIALAPGDVLLAVTDGLPEMLDPGDAMFGYEALKSRFAELAERPPGEILDHLFTAASDWAAGRQQEDDLTLLAVRQLEI